MQCLASVDAVSKYTQTLLCNRSVIISCAPCPLDWSNNFGNISVNNLIISLHKLGILPFVSVVHSNVRLILTEKVDADVHFWDLVLTFVPHKWAQELGLLILDAVVHERKLLPPKVCIHYQMTKFNLLQNTKGITYISCSLIYRKNKDNKGIQRDREQKASSLVSLTIFDLSIPNFLRTRWKRIGGNHKKTREEKVQTKSRLYQLR